MSETAITTTWNSKEVRARFGLHMLGQHGVYYPAPKPKRLMVGFSSMGSDRYDRYSWFWNSDEQWDDTAYLFLKDDSFNYFLGTDAAPTTQSFRKIILHHMEKAGVDAKQVFAFGGSMGGYAAIYFAAFMGFGGAIVANPQTEYAAARAHTFQNWERQIRNTGSQWYDLAEWIHKFPQIPNIYIEYGEYRADRLAAEHLLDALRAASNSLVIARKTDWKGHTVDCLSQTTIESAVQFFENHGFGERRSERTTTALPTPPEPASSPVENSLA